MSSVNTVSAIPPEQPVNDTIDFTGVRNAVNDLNRAAADAAKVIRQVDEFLSTSNPGVSINGPLLLRERQVHPEVGERAEVKLRLCYGLDDEDNWALLVETSGPVFREVSNARHNDCMWHQDDEEECWSVLRLADAPPHVQIEALKELPSFLTQLRLEIGKAAACLQLRVTAVQHSLQHMQTTTICEPNEPKEKEGENDECK